MSTQNQNGKKTILQETVVFGKVPILKALLYDRFWCWALLFRNFIVSTYDGGQEGGKDSMEEPRQEIINSFKAGRRQEFAQLYDQYVDKIYAFLYVRSGHRETAEDLTSTVFLKALSRFSTYQSGSFSAWLYKIARHVLIDHYRVQKPTVDIDGIPEPVGHTNLEHEVEQHRDISSVRQAMQGLTKQQRDILILRIWDDLPYRVIAEIVGKTEPAVKMTFARAIAALQINLNITLSILITLTVTVYGHIHPLSLR